MESDDGSSEMKSAYQVALERLEEQGIARPRDEGLDPAVRRRIADVRNRSEASLAQLEILLSDRLKGTLDPHERAKAEEEYTHERRRIEERRDREIERLRSGG